MAAGLYVNKQDEPIIDDDVIIDDVITDSYVHSIDNRCDLSEDVINVIKEYNERYYKSLCNLELENVDDLFSDELNKNISNYAESLQIEARKLYNFDFKCDKAYFDLVIDSYYKDGNSYVVDVLEDDTFFFNFLDGIESKQCGIEVRFIIDEDLKIKRIDKVQDYWIFFDDESEDRYPNSIDEVIDTYNEYLETINDCIYENEYDKKMAKQVVYVADKSYAHSYDRYKAVEYIDKYWHEHNKEYFDFSDLGGNCQNFASQAIHYAGVEMDVVGDRVWKFYDDALDNSNEKTGRSSSWASVYYFYQYAKRNNDGGIVADTGINKFYGEPGDIIQVGYNKEYIHTTMISKIVDDHILINANTTDAKNYPIEAYLYPYVRLIKILGYNQLIMIVGAYTNSENKEITAELKEIFVKALEDYDVYFEPIELLAIQVVAGINYRFLCKTNDGIKKIVTIYKDLKGNCKITDVQEYE